MTTAMRLRLDRGEVRTVVAFGDSIVEGYGVGEGWPGILGRKLATLYPGVAVVNAGRSGETAAAGLRRLDREVLGRSPEVVLVAFGLNEVRKHVPPGDFRRELTAVVERLSAGKITVVLLTTTRLIRGGELLAALEVYNDVIRQVAAERGLLLIDVYRQAGGINTREFLLDAVHPNALGHERLAAIIEEGLIGKAR